MLHSALPHIAVIVVFANVWLVANNDWQQFGWLQEFAVSHPLRASYITNLQFPVSIAGGGQRGELNIYKNRLNVG